MKQTNGRLTIAVILMGACLLAVMWACGGSTPPTPPDVRGLSTLIPGHRSAPHSVQVLPAPIEPQGQNELQFGSFCEIGCGGVAAGKAIYPDAPRRLHQRSNTSVPCPSVPIHVMRLPEIEALYVWPTAKFVDDVVI